MTFPLRHCRGPEHHPTGELAGRSTVPKQVRLLPTALLLVTMLAPLACAQVFHEDFSGPTLDPTKWDLSLGGGSAAFANGRLTLSAPPGQFPYLTSKYNPFPAQGDFMVRVGFRYPDVQIDGNGFGAEYVERGFGVWQDLCCGPLRVAVGDLYPFYPPGLPNPDTGYHTYEWDYLGGAYYFYLDGSFVTSSLSSYRPTQVFFGHPPQTAAAWTTQEVDFVHVEWLNVVPAKARTWGRLKTLYR
jgi:hypothetical protein